MFQTVPVRSDLFHFTPSTTLHNSAPDKPLPGLGRLVGIKLSFQLLFIPLDKLTHIVI